jgi:hypothetical protein
VVIDPVGGPRIAYDRDDLANDLVETVRSARGDQVGITPTPVVVEDYDLKGQFDEVIKSIREIFEQLAFIAKAAPMRRSF